MSYKADDDLSPYDKDKEVLTLETARESDGNFILSFCYRPHSLLRKNCPNTEFFWFVFFRIWTEYGDLRSKNSVFGHCSRSGCDSENLSLFLQNTIIEKSLLEKEISNMLIDFNMTCLSYHDNAETKHFYGTIFEKGAIPIMNCPTQIAENLASIIDNVLSTYIFKISLKKRNNQIGCS